MEKEMEKEKNIFMDRGKIIYILIDYMKENT